MSRRRAPAPTVSVDGASRQLRHAAHRYHTAPAEERATAQRALEDAALLFAIARVQADPKKPA